MYYQPAVSYRYYDDGRRGHGRAWGHEGRQHHGWGHGGRGHDEGRRGGHR